MSRTRAGLVLLTLIAGGCGGDSTGPGNPPGGGTGAALEIGPSAVLLTEAGATQQLTAFMVDASGRRTPVSATFRSSHPGTVSVSAGGLLTAVTGPGSSLIVAEAEGLTSPPSLVLVAEPVAGALLVSDEQVDGLPVAVDPNAEYAVGWLERVRLKGVTPTVGQVVLGTGGLPIAGRVTSVSGAGSGTVEIVYQLVPISELFAAIAVDERIPLANAVTVEGAPSGPSQRLGNAPRFAPAEVGRPEQKFDLGPFECEAKFEGTLAPVELDLFTFDMTPDLTADLIVADLTVKRLVVHGSISPRLTMRPVLKAGMKGELGCKFHWKTIILPIGGPISRFVGAQVPIGAGVAVEAKTELGGFGYEAVLEASASVSLGFDCAAGCEAVADGSVTGGGSFKPVLPNALDEFRSELAASFFGYAELSLGSPLARELQFSAFEVKAGLAQKAELATERAQALDTAYKSSIRLAPFFEAGTTLKVADLGKWLGVNLAQFKKEGEAPPIARTPLGTLTISPSTVAPGNGQALGETATFTVTLNPVTYLSFDAVDQVEIRWLRPDGNGGVTLEAGRPGCTTISASSGQTTFTCSTDFLEEHRGEQTFFAFVKPKLFGLSLPIGLEIASATVTVGESGFTTLETARVFTDAGGDPNVECIDTNDPPPAPVPAPASASTSLTCSGSATLDGFTSTTQSDLAASLTIGHSETGRSVRLTGSQTTSISFPHDPDGGADPLGGSAGSGSTRSVFFTVPEGTTFTYALTGSLAGSTSSGCPSVGQVVARVFLVGGPMAGVLLQAGFPGLAPSVTVNSSGSLPAGSYQFSAQIEDLIHQNEECPASQSSAASYDITLTLTPVP